MYAVPDYKLEPSEDKIFCDCDECGGEIYEGDDMYDISGDRIHKECLEEYVSGFKCIAEKVGA